MSEMSRSPRGSKQHGFSLVELMVVVTITGVLMATAIPTFSDYIQRGRTSEAVQVLGSIVLRQEAYRAEFGQYLQCAGIKKVSDITYTPGGISVMKNAISKAWDDTSDTTIRDCFQTIGVRPDGGVRFGYGYAAGIPGDMSSTDETTYGLTPIDRDHWYVIQAVSDLDGDGTGCTFEMTSVTQGRVWIGTTIGGATVRLAQGWE